MRVCRQTANNGLMDYATAKRFFFFIQARPKGFVVDRCGALAGCVHGHEQPENSFLCSNTPSICPIGLITRCCSRNLHQTFGGFAALGLWAAPTDHTLTPGSVRSAYNPSHSRCFDTTLLSVTRYASLSDRGPGGFALTPATFPVCLPSP